MVFAKICKLGSINIFDIHLSSPNASKLPFWVTFWLYSISLLKYYRYFVLVIQYVSFSVVLADFDCLCNYNEELKVYSAATESSTVIGSLYEFDCKPTLDATQEHAFKGIQFEQQVKCFTSNPRYAFNRQIERMEKILSMQ